MLGLAVLPQATQVLPHPRADQTCQLIVRESLVRHGRDNVRGWAQRTQRVSTAEAGRRSDSVHKCAVTLGLAGGRNDRLVNEGGCERRAGGSGSDDGGPAAGS